MSLLNEKDVDSRQQPSEAIPENDYTLSRMQVCYRRSKCATCSERFLYIGLQHFVFLFIAEPFCSRNHTCSNNRFFLSIPPGAYLRMTDRMCHSEENPQREAPEESAKTVMLRQAFRDSLRSICFRFLLSSPPGAYLRMTDRLIFYSVFT